MNYTSLLTVRGSQHHRYLKTILFVILLFLLMQRQNWGQTAVSPTYAGAAEWPMAAANPERTSWTAEEVRGQLRPEWYKPFEPYIPQRVQIIAANGLLYISTANGLYALDANTGAEVWVYPTDMPLGHSPTIDNGVAYVGGLDHKLHAIDALTGQGLWTFEAEAGFETNPVVAEGKVFLGNRDGYFYAVYATGANAGQLAWKYKTGGPILYSAAYKDGILYFASNDSYAYALNAQTGQLVWKSAKLPGAGFYSWWPVVYQNRVIFSGSNNYGTAVSWPDSGQMTKIELKELYQDNNIPANGELIGQLSTASGNWAPGTPTINANRILNYFNQKPWRKTVFVLDKNTGAEAETAPVLWAGTHSGTRYPPVVGVDGVLYQQNNYMSDPSIAGGQIAGWQPGVPYISVISSDWGAVDEPHAASAGGNLIYWSLCCDRQAGAVDITIPNTGFIDRYNAGFRPPTGASDQTREWTYINYNLTSLAPGYNSLYYNAHPNYTKPYTSFGGPTKSPNGVYGFHGDVNPPIPYNGRVYMHRSNVVMAFSPSGGSPTTLPMATIRSAPATKISNATTDELKAMLETEIQKILDAGHLRPAYMTHGLLDTASPAACGDDIVNYWHNPAETLYTLIWALPYLSSSMQQQVRTYLQNEYASYPPYLYNHIGYSNGASREFFDVPPEIEAALATFGPEQENSTFRNNGGWGGEGVWKINPFAFYALWKYAETFGDAATIWANSQSAFWLEFNDQPSDTLLLNMPLVHNAYIAGYWGYLELEKLAGQPESVNVRNELNRLLQLRANNLTPNTAYLTFNQSPYCRTLNVSSNFMYLTPELAGYLRDNAMDKVTAVLDEFHTVAPYWFVTLFSGGYAENAIVPIYDAHSIFMAHALILQESGQDLEKYLDVPVFARGDLYYIQKLVATIENQAKGFSMTITPSVQRVDTGGTAVFTIDLQPTGNFTDTVTLTFNNPDPVNLTVAAAQTTFNSLPAQTTLTLTDKHANLNTPLWYNVTVTATGGNEQATTTVSLLINGLDVFLPVIRR